MWSRWLADLLVVLHLGFVVFVAFGGLLGWVWRRAPWLHLPAALWGVAIEVGGWICPLTHLENHLRRRAGQAGYSGGFIEHYMVPVLYPQGLTRGMQLTLAAVLLLFNIAVYTALWRRRQRR